VVPRTEGLAPACRLVGLDGTAHQPQDEPPRRAMQSVVANPFLAPGRISQHATTHNFEMTIIRVPHDLNEMIFSRDFACCSTAAALECTCASFITCNELTISGSVVNGPTYFEADCHDLSTTELDLD